MPGASLTKFFTPNSIGAGSSSTLTITIKSTGGVSLTGMGLKEDLSTDTNPSGLKISSAATSNTCNGNLTATPGTTLIQLANGSLAANSTCAITVGVTGDTAGSYLNCIPASRLTDTNSPAVTNQSPACDTLTVTNSAALGDYVWDDANHNGIQDAGENGIGGVTVTLYGLEWDDGAGDDDDRGGWFISLYGTRRLARIMLGSARRVDIRSVRSMRRAARPAMTAMRIRRPMSPRART